MVAILNLQQAVKLTPEGHSDLPVMLNNLGISYQSCFSRTEDIADLTEAIQKFQQAVQLTPKGHPDLPARLGNLGISYQSHFERTGDIAELVKAIQNKKQAVKLTPKGDSGLPALISNLGISMSYHSCFKRTGDLADFAEAVQNFQQAIKFTPKGHPDLSEWLINLGNLYQSCFERTGDMTDLVKAICNQQEAVKLTPTGHSILSNRLSNLGKLYKLHFSYSQDYNSFNYAISHFHLAAISETGSLAIRLSAAQFWIQLSKSVSCSQSDLMMAYDLVIHLLTLLTGFDTMVHNRYQKLTKFSDAKFPLAAAATAISAEKFHKAIEWLEQGRCIVWNQLNQLRSSTENLQLQYPDLAKRLSFISTTLENAGLRNDCHIDNNSQYGKPSWNEEYYYCIKLARERDELINTIRNRSGFQDFLQPKKFADLMNIIL